MSTEIFEVADSESGDILSVNRFYGGENRGLCCQFTIVPQRRGAEPVFVQITAMSARVLADAILKSLKK